MKATAFVPGLALLAVACAVEKKQEERASDSAAIQTPTPSVSTPAVAPAVTDSTDTGATLPSKKTKSKRSAADSERDSATEPLFVLGEDGKLHRIKK
jgi:hypothetical protein